MQNYSTVRYSIESAGNLLYAVSHLLGMEKTDDSYQLFKVGFSQYVKGEYNITRHQIFDKNNRFVYHFGAGVGIPFANSNIIPFEKRFYSGGANSVRGWGESMLGPGAYSRFTGNKTRDFNQVGDIKLDMNMEYRTKLFWKAEGAAFIDAGNIWTIDSYESQSLGQFKFDSFYNQLALAYGLGLRFDFSFFILRFDVGTKLFDPSEKLRSEQWKTRFDKDNYAFHFAIGYPF
jgi:outer membrane protein assembly factor BamA